VVVDADWSEGSEQDHSQGVNGEVCKRKKKKAVERKKKALTRAGRFFLTS
jgi:hypothetical protein